MRRRIGLVVVLVALLCGLVGCRSGGDPSAGSVSPGPVISASSSTPTPSGVSEEEAALYAEAERVFRAAMAAQVPYGGRGDYSEFPAEMADYYGPEYLEFMRQDFEQAAVDGLHAPGGDPVITVAPAPSVSKGDSEVAIMTCVDGRHLTVLNARGEVVGQGTLGAGTSFLKHYDGVLKIFDEEVQEVETCPLD